MTASVENVATAMRLGWAVAEVRGRNWPQGPRPKATRLPPQPGDVLPLRSQRTGSASRREAVLALVSLTQQIGFEDAQEFEAELSRSSRRSPPRVTRRWWPTARMRPTKPAGQRSLWIPASSCRAITIRCTWLVPS